MFRYSYRLQIRVRNRTHFIRNLIFMTFKSVKNKHIFKVLNVFKKSNYLLFYIFGIELRVFKFNEEVG